MCTAPVNKILPYSVVDGPGNRAAIFLQKCNIRCAYCHNPETQTLCRNCGDCLSVCPTGALRVRGGLVQWESSLCCGCDSCIRRCPHNASPKVIEMTPTEVFGKVRESLPFIRGITVSGGECSLYPAFLRELFILARRENLTCLMDSNGTVDLSRYPDLTAVCDGVTLDVKAWNAEVFRSLTGSGNEIVKKNLRFLSGIGKLTELRVVCLPDLVDAQDCICGIAQTLGQGVAEQIPLKLIRFRHFGVRGALSDCPSPDMPYMQSLQTLAKQLGFRNVRIL